mmetsp:Transcript_30776/g.66643  ORF Transcript_30776/g.66643 Transcript_30776/m.66643 type:complete len:81 (-) Transcript_30776:1495-1737(-)
MKRRRDVLDPFAKALGYEIGDGVVAYSDHAITEPVDSLDIRDFRIATAPKACGSDKKSGPQRRVRLIVSIQIDLGDILNV